MHYLHRKRFSLAHAIAALLVSLQLFSLALAQEDSPVKDPEQWVADLANPNPQLRRAAEVFLLAAGDEALPAVRAGMRSFDIETGARCKILFEKIEVQRRERISKRFLTDDDAEDTSAAEDVAAELKAWPAFSTFVKRSDNLAKKLFLEMCDELPLVFEDYAINGQQTVAELKKKARLVLVDEKTPDASSVARSIAYFFLADLVAGQLSEEELKKQLGKVETLEGVQYFSGFNVAESIRQSDYRDIVEGCFSKWLKQQMSFGRISDDDKFKLVYKTGNGELMRDLEKSFASLSVSQKLKFIDIVAEATSGRETYDWCHTWLKEPLADETVALSTRLEKKPAKKIDVSIRMLAEGVLATAIKRSSGTGEPIKTESVFGSYPFSHLPYLIVADEKERKQLSDYLKSDSK